ncbi:MAG: chitobiase/beta-hexosaminidase C-terminal domain-containing protein, partial [Maribacter sp.]|nr:chitobiase/beta-hexosaminidase C-terminal domain-containing protein [Maribacter sp.]
MIAQIIQIGHLHPLVVHLPIGILLLGFILEIVYRKKPSEASNEIILMVLLIGAFSAVISLGTGWLLGEDGGYDETLLFRHRWLAVAFTVLAIGLYLLKKATNAMAFKLYLPVYVIVLILIGITGHYGGSMTHGEYYLFTDTRIKKVVIEDVDKAQVYTDIVQPIFNTKCVGCHNPSKIKGGLLMDTKENLLAGGDSGNILDSVSGNEASLFMQRLHLPLEDEDHMPPKGKVQPTAEELALLAWWMENDHCFDCVAGTLDKSEKMGDILQGLEEDRSPRALMAKNLKPVPKDWIAQLNHSDISTYPLAEGNPLLQVSLNGRQDIRQGDFKALKKYAKHIVELNLGNSNFNDTLSKSLSSFKNLTKLQLQNAPITDNTIENLKGLQHLESLNLYGDSISDKALNVLGNLKNLKNIYLWQTNITEEALKQYALDHPHIAVQGQIDSDIFRATKLEPPTIVADSDFFKDSLQVELDYVFDDASIYYTLDGSEPDSTSLKYTTPITLTKSAEVKAVTYAPGWN